MFYLIQLAGHLTSVISVLATIFIKPEECMKKKMQKITFKKHSYQKVKNNLMDWFGCCALNP